MSKKDSLPPFQLAICERLRSFRESKQIPRTAFAAAVGLVGKRLENCELGITPLTYGVFRAVNERFFVSPSWLLTGEGRQSDDQPFSQFIGLPKINPRELLSVAWERDIAPLVEKRFNGCVDEFVFVRQWQEDLLAMEKKFADPNLFNRLPAEAQPTIEAARKDVARSLESMKKVGQRLARLFNYISES